MVGIVKNNIHSQEYLNQATVRRKYQVNSNELFSGAPRLLFFLQIVFENGDEIDVYSDLTWMGRQNAMLHDSIYNGEFVDSRHDRPNWSQVGFNDTFSLWLPAERMTSPINETLHGQIVMQDMPPIRAGPDALHFEVTVTPVGGYLSSNDIGQIRGATFADGGILKPISTWSPTIGQWIIEKNSVTIF
jgi:Alpha-L-rhamnosidase N-terminal domain